MKTQILIRLAKIFNLVTILPPIDLPPEEPIRASSRDYGFDFDEDELARELLAPLPDGLANQAVPEVSAEEFESRYLWFIS